MYLAYIHGMGILSAFSKSPTPGMPSDMLAIAVHPLDWPSYLKQTLIVDPIPSFLTLMLVSAHFYGCCLADHGLSPSNKSASSTQSTSYLGYAFESAGAFTRHIVGPGSCSIKTPFTHVAQHVFDRHNTTRHNSSGNSTLPQDQSSATAGEEQLNVREAILSAAMTDPMSMLFDVWAYMYYSEEDIPVQESQPQTHEQQDPKVCSKNTSTDEAQVPETSSFASQRHLSGHESTDVWRNVRIIHSIGAAGILVPLIPSMFGTHRLLSNSIPSVHATVWGVINSCILVLGTSLVTCCSLQFIGDMPQLALCTAMHSVCRIMVAYANMCVDCPLPPIFMPTAVASGMGMGVALLLLFVGHVDAMGGVEGSEGFYMYHAWACGYMLLMMRQGVFSVAVWPWSLTHVRMLRRAGLCNSGPRSVDCEYEYEDEDK